ncbi:MAG: glycosyltransferase family 4 protein [Chitinophagaceae bacterium]|nr:glycosyltransferase family 4 protein [Chitinophagaceae bacterium]
MKWLSITWYKVLPPHFGGQKCIAQFNQALGLQATGACLCSADNETTESLSYSLLPHLPVGKKQFLLPRAGKVIMATAKKERPTHIILEHPYYGKSALKACKATGAKLVLHAHNIEADRFREAGKTGWKWVRRVEKKTMQKADLILFLTNEDISRAVSLYQISPVKCMLAPYGIHSNMPIPDASKTIRQKFGIAAKEKIFLFAGTLDYEPNAQAVEKIYSILAPALDNGGIPAKIIICGRNRGKKFKYLKALNHPQVIQAGEVDDIGLYFSAADLFINPVEKGSGTQTKTLEALSWHCNVVSFSFGIHGIDPEQCDGKLQWVENSDWASFTLMLLMAYPRKPTPDHFLNFYNQDDITREVLKRMNSL